MQKINDIKKTLIIIALLAFSALAILFSVTIYAQGNQTAIESHICNEKSDRPDTEAVGIDSSVEPEYIELLE